MERNQMSNGLYGHNFENGNDQPCINCGISVSMAIVSQTPCHVVRAFQENDLEVMEIRLFGRVLEKSERHNFNPETNSCIVCGMSKTKFTMTGDICVKGEINEAS